MDIFYTDAQIKAVREIQGVLVDRIMALESRIRDLEQRAEREDEARYLAEQYDTR